MTMIIIQLDRFKLTRKGTVARRWKKKILNWSKSPVIITQLTQLTWVESEHCNDCRDKSSSLCLFFFLSFFSFLSLSLFTASHVSVSIICNCIHLLTVFVIGLLFYPLHPLPLSLHLLYYWCCCYCCCNFYFSRRIYSLVALKVKLPATWRLIGWSLMRKFLIYNCTSQPMTITSASPSQVILFVSFVFFSLFFLHSFYRVKCYMISFTSHFLPLVSQHQYKCFYISRSSVCVHHAWM